MSEGIRGTCSCPWQLVLMIMGFSRSSPKCFVGDVLQNELELLGRIRHPNIVSLLGFCVHDGNHFIVYELMEKGSLETQLHGIVFLL